MKRSKFNKSIFPPIENVNFNRVRLKSRMFREIEHQRILIPRITAYRKKRKYQLRKQSQWKITEVYYVNFGMYYLAKVRRRGSMSITVLTNEEHARALGASELLSPNRAS